MSRYTKSIFKKSRRLGFSILEDNKEFLKGKKRTYAPGQHGADKHKVSGYGQQLQEKQKLALMYGMNDRQFRRLFQIAKKMKGSTSMNLLIVLESRLDNLVYRMGFAKTRRAARQMVSHGHILLNGKKCSIPSTIVPLNSIIEVKEASKKMAALGENETRGTLPFVKTDFAKLSGQYVRYPERKELNQEINETYVVEWFNR